MRLIFKGKILKDEQGLDFYKITDGLTIHMVKGMSANVAKPAEQAQTQPEANAQPSTQSANIQPNAQPAAGGMGGMPMGGLGGMGGMPMGMPMGGMGGLGGAGGMPNPQQMQQMMNNPMVQ